LNRVYYNYLRKKGAGADMENLIEIKTNDKLELIISLRDLHNKLRISERYSNWTERMFKYGFTENVDYTGCKVFNKIRDKGSYR